MLKKLCAIAALSLPACSIMQAQTMDLTLKKAIEIAMAENPTIRIADKEIKLKEIADKEAWQALLPTVDASLSLSHSIKVAAIKTGMGEFKMGQDGTTTATGALQVAIPLFAPAVYQNMKLTKDDILLAQENARSSRLDLINQVTKAYYAALMSQDSYEVMKRSYNVAKQNYDIVEQKYNVGQVSEYDKISADVQVRSMNSSVVSAETSLTLAKLKLKVLMGITNNLDIRLKDSLTAYESSMTLANIDGGTYNVEGNSAIRQIDLNQKKLELANKIIRTNFMPTVALALTGQYQSYSNDNWNIFNYKYSPSSTLALSVNIPIYHASNYTKLKTNALQVQQLADQRDNTIQQLTMAAKSYRSNMVRTLTKMESDREAVKQADKAVSISSKRYEVGRGTILELNQSEVALTQAELTYRQNIYDFLVNKADLDYTLGKEQ